MMFKTASLLISCLVAITMVMADQILIYGPPKNAVYSPNDIVDIRYTVRAMGMTKIWSAAAKLTQTESNTIIESFPKAEWTSENNGKSSGKKATAHKSWIVPADIPEGNYTLTIVGKSTHPCSKNNDGKAPFQPCQEEVTRERTFYIQSRSAAAIEEEQ
ncbi:hypothetical protein BDF20DRAFT_900871 [Mycotypha africana]|uniref:uncharacterized protein n=1 Tax=Mycotypha africana TaxID=64632 RepID=UPI002301D21C|nr:uncharacterized protein BDF20DRAFT_900871 [Mycotypha africana]KAI8967400.1 hypothetical protein BDF20DRAFT_900871 [Mycotypha africana]